MDTFIIGTHDNGHFYNWDTSITETFFGPIKICLHSFL